MHVRLVSLAIALLSAASTACIGPPRYTEGSASYVTDGNAGALPLRALLCVSADGAKNTALRLGEGCTLRGSAHGIGRARGATAPLEADGECVLPLRAGAPPEATLKVQTATLRTLNDGVSAMVGGVLPDGRYVTYRFDGSDGDEAPPNACAALFPRVQGDSSGETFIAPGRQAWESSAGAPFGPTGK